MKIKFLIGAVFITVNALAQIDTKFYNLHSRIDNNQLYVSFENLLDKDSIAYIQIDIFTEKVWVNGIYFAKRIDNVISSKNGQCSTNKIGNRFAYNISEPLGTFSKDVMDSIRITLIDKYNNRTTITHENK